MSDDLGNRLQSLIEWLQEDPDNIHHLPADQVAKLRAWLNGEPTPADRIAALGKRRAAVSDVEPYDLVQQAMGRARFCRDRGEVKTPELLEELIACIAALEAERDQVRRDFDATWAVDIPFHQGKYLTERARADRLEAEVARLRKALEGERSARPRCSRTP